MRAVRPRQVTSGCDGGEGGEGSEGGDSDQSGYYEQPKCKHTQNVLHMYTH